MVEGSININKELILRLHSVLRPFILRRLKSEVETQMPKKYYHIVKCNLSKRQKELYEEYISRSSTRNVLEQGNFMNLMGILMQLRKVCNHPDLFEARPIISPFEMRGIELAMPKLLKGDTYQPPHTLFDLIQIDDVSITDVNILAAPIEIATKICYIPELFETLPYLSLQETQKYIGIYNEYVEKKKTERSNIFRRILHRNQFKWSILPIYNYYCRNSCRVPLIRNEIIPLSNNPRKYFKYSNALRQMISSYEERLESMTPFIKRYCIVIYPIRINNIKIVEKDQKLIRDIKNTTNHYDWWLRRNLLFPDKWLVQYDCGKLQELHKLLMKLKQENHKCLVFTQMSKMLDILEYFMNLHSFTYLRLDGSTSINDRQVRMDKFNNDKKIFCFILSTRSGGLGINLIGADTVIFYDSDWNPSIDAQAQDRAHRIGQTRDVNIYRLITQFTVEENILKKANSKRHLNQLSLEEGHFNMESMYKDFTIKDIIGLAPTDALDINENSQGPTPEEIAQAMQLYEDDGDKQAQIALQEEMKLEEDMTPIAEQEEKVKWMEVSESDSIEQSLPQVQQLCLKHRTEYDCHPYVNYDLLLTHAQEMEERENIWEKEQEEEMERAEQEINEKDSNFLMLEAVGMKSYKMMEKYYKRCQVLYKKEMHWKELKGDNWKTLSDSKTGKLYYLNKYTGEKQWEMPLMLRKKESYNNAKKYGYKELPDEILRHICNYLVPYKDGMSFSKVCSHWNKVYTPYSIDIFPDTANLPEIFSSITPGTKLIFHSGSYGIKEDLVITKTVSIAIKGEVCLNLFASIILKDVVGGVFFNGLRIISQSKKCNGSLIIRNTNCTIQSCMISHANGTNNAIIVEERSNLTFLKSRINYSPLNGIIIVNSKCYIGGSTISECDKYGIVAISGSLLLYHSMIINNKEYGLRLFNGSKAVVEYNYFSRNELGSILYPSNFNSIIFKLNDFPQISSNKQKRIRDFENFSKKPIKRIKIA